MTIQLSSYYRCVHSRRKAGSKSAGSSNVGSYKLLKSTLPCRFSAVMIFSWFLSLLFSSASVAFLCNVQKPSSRSPLQTLSYGAFTQTATYSIANQLGYFTGAGLNVTYVQISSSTTGYASLLDGTYDILTGTIDNAVNLRFNQNKSITVAGQVDSGPDLIIAAVSSINRLSDLRGSNIIVDSATSGYAYILRKVLSLYGLQPNTDYSLLAVGSTAIRYGYLRAGQLPNGTKVAATILTYPFTEYLNLQNYSAPPPKMLARISDFINPLSSSALTVAESTLDPSSPIHNKVVSFISAMLKANAVLADTKQKNCAIEAIGKQLNVTSDIAALEYAAATNVETGETATMQQGVFNVSRQGLLNVIDVRAQFGGFEGAGPGFDFADAIVPGAGKLIDYSLRDEARALAG